MVFDAPAIERLDIPAYNWWNECLHGVGRAGVATVFPQAIGLAATWNSDLMHRIATNMFHPEHKQVVFVPRLGTPSQFTDPSYHLPHYYELWARWADKDNEFWYEAAAASREFFKKGRSPRDWGDARLCQL